jgi:hypothetical protein
MIYPTPMREETLARLRDHGYPTYQAYLRSPEWRARKKRLNLRKSCWICNSRKDLITHHCDYSHICRERKKDLVVLCDDHHRGLHEFQRANRIKLINAHVVYKAHLRRHPLRPKTKLKTRRKKKNLILRMLAWALR